MTPAARAQAAIDLLDRWMESETGMDRLLAQWGRASRYAGSGDRRAVADLVYDALRRKRSAAWVAGKEEPDGRALIRGTLLLDGRAPGEVFTGAPHGPEPLAGDEEGSMALDEAPGPVRLDLPDWIAEHLADMPGAALAPLRRRASVYLRVNTLKADQASAIAALTEDGIAAEPGPLSPTSLLVPDRPHRVAAARAYQDGLVEIQDAASQAVADYAMARPGETVLDLCAGGGGKTLAMAAHMAGEGQLLAYDAAPERLAQLAPRAQRAGAEIACLEEEELPGLDGRCDLVLVDAPCTGSGAWARNPDAKWRLTPGRLEALTVLQDRILDRAVRLLSPGGRLVYATCSLLERENGARVSALVSRHPDLASGRPPMALTPDQGGDGFYAAEFILR